MPSNTLSGMALYCKVAESNRSILAVDSWSGAIARLAVVFPGLAQGCLQIEGTTLSQLTFQPDLAAVVLGD